MFILEYIDNRSRCKAVLFRVRRTWFETIEEMQAVLDDYLTGYNQRGLTRAAA